MVWEALVLIKVLQSNLRASVLQLRGRDNAHQFFQQCFVALNPVAYFVNEPRTHMSDLHWAEEAISALWLQLKHERVTAVDFTRNTATAAS